MHFLQDAVRDARPGVCRIRHAEESVVGRGGRPRGGDGGGRQDRGTLRLLPATDQQSRSHRGTRDVTSTSLQVLQLVSGLVTANLLMLTDRHFDPQTPAFRAGVRVLDRADHPRPELQLQGGVRAQAGIHRGAAAEGPPQDRPLGARKSGEERENLTFVPSSILQFKFGLHLGTNMSDYRFSDIGGAHPTAKVEARIRVGAPADADDAQGGPSDAAAVGGDGPRGGQEGQEGPAHADPVHARVVEPASRFAFCYKCT